MNNYIYTEKELEGYFKRGLIKIIMRQSEALSKIAQGFICIEDYEKIKDVANRTELNGHLLEHGKLKHIIESKIISLN